MSDRERKAKSLSKFVNNAWGKLGLASKISKTGSRVILGATLVLAVGAGYLAVSRTYAATTTPIQHVVVLYLENHSFDNVYGFWCNQNPGRCPDGGMPSSVTLSNGAVVTPSTDPDMVPNVKHDGNSQVAAMDNGKMDGWQNISGGGCSATTGYQCISGYQPSQIPNLASVANNFAINDNTFSMVDSPSWEGHLYAVAASTDGFWGPNPSVAKGTTTAPGWGCDSDKVAPWYASPGSAQVMAPSCVPDWSLGLPNGGAFESTPVPNIPTIMDRLDQAQQPWKIYSAVKGTKGYGVWDVCPSFAGCLDTNQGKNLVPDGQFATDAAAGNLPAFSLITPGGKDMASSCHNDTSMTACDDWVGQIVSNVESSPEWSSTALFITFDDFGGFYDQVYPGTNTNPNLTQQGPRSPMIVVSPYAKAGTTDTTHASFAGILSFTEHNFGLPPLGPNDAYAYDLNNMFDFTQTPLQPVPMIQRPLTSTQLNPPLDPNDPT